MRIVRSIELVGVDGEAMEEMIRPLAPLGLHARKRDFLDPIGKAAAASSSAR